MADSSSQSVFHPWLIPSIHLTPKNQYFPGFGRLLFGHFRAFQKVQYRIGGVISEKEIGCVVFAGRCMRYIDLAK